MRRCNVLKTLLALVSIGAVASCSSEEHRDSVFPYPGVTAGGLYLALEEGDIDVSVVHGIDSFELRVCTDSCGKLEIKFDVSLFVDMGKLQGQLTNELRDGIFVDRNDPNRYIYLGKGETGAPVVTTISTVAEDQTCARDFIQRLLHPIHSVKAVR